MPPGRSATLVERDPLQLGHKSVYAAPCMHDVSIIHPSMHVVACIVGVLAWLESMTGSRAS